MTRVRCSITMSLDGFTAGPDQTEEHPMGKNGHALHGWAFPLKFFHEMQGKPGGDDNVSDAAIREQQGNVGANIMGRNMFGPIRGPWSSSKTWEGWWGPNPPYHCDVFVLTHHARADLVKEGGNVFHFVTDGPAAALAQAKKAAGTKDVHVVGGASCVRQFLKLGAIEELTINLSPVFLGQGERLFDDVGDAMAAFTHARTVHGPIATHLTFRRR